MRRRVLFLTDDWNVYKNKKADLRVVVGAYEKNLFINPEKLGQSGSKDSGRAEGENSASA